MVEKSSVYIDACCFIEIAKFEAEIDVGDQRKTEVWYTKKLLQAHRDREINVFTSTLTIAECLHVGGKSVPNDVQLSLDALLTSGQYLSLVQPTPFICIDARNLRWNDGITLKGADGVHLASALERKCSEFISFDGRFGRVAENSNALKAKGLSVYQPSQTKALPSKYLQGDLLDGRED